MAITRLTLPLVWHLAFLCVVYLVPAQAMTPEQMVEELIGAPVYASDGHEVGEVVDVSTSAMVKLMRSVSRQEHFSAWASVCWSCSRVILWSCAAQ
jgi:hypothetical protein